MGNNLKYLPKEAGHVLLHISLLMAQSQIMVVLQVHKHSCEEL